MKKLFAITLIAFGLASAPAMADGNWTKLASINPGGIAWDVYVDSTRTDTSRHTGWFKLVQIGGEPSGYYSIEIQAVVDCQSKQIQNPVVQPYQNYGKDTMDTPTGEYSQPWHDANLEHTDGVILKHLCQ